MGKRGLGSLTTVQGDIIPQIVEVWKVVNIDGPQACPVSPLRAAA